MSFNWNDAWDDTLDWSNTAFWQMFLDAIRERCMAAALVQATLPASPPTVSNTSSPGDDVQWANDGWTAYSLICSPPYGPAPQTQGWVNKTILEMQNAITVAWWAFADPTQGSHFACNRPWFSWKMQGIAVTTAAASMGFASQGVDIGTGAWQGLPFWDNNTLVYSTSEFAGFAFTYPFGAGSPPDTFLPWRRRVPRSTSDTLNTPVAGMVAWNASNSLSVYDGTSWVATTDTTKVPDLLDSANSPTGGYWTKPGWIQAGDYIGWWLFAEIRDVLNKMVWTTDAFASFFGGFIFAATELIWAAGSTTTYRGFSSGQASAAAAEAAAVASQTTSSLSPGIFLAQLSDSGGSWGANYTVATGTLAVSTLWQGANSQTDCYLVVNTTTSSTVAYNSFGTGLSNVAPAGALSYLPTNFATYYQLWDTVAYVGTPGAATWGQVNGSVVFGATDPTPYWPSPPSSGSKTTEMTISVGGRVTRWDVAGGFQYTNGTPYAP